MTAPLFVRASTFHGRRGGPTNDFRYDADFVLLPMGQTIKDTVRLFSVERRNLFSFRHSDHGDGEGKADAWAKAIIDDHDLTEICDGETWLLTQPRCFGFAFNPVSFWFFLDCDGELRAVLAEVNNTFGDRHIYLCRHSDGRPITSQDRIRADKVFHVSPFQKVAGAYHFRFHFSKDRIGAWIDFRDGENGLYATVTGSVEEMTDRELAASALRLPFGALRVLSLIHWQALKLKLKGAEYLRRPAPPKEQVTT